MEIYLFVILLCPSISVLTKLPTSKLLACMISDAFVLSSIIGLNNSYEIYMMQYQFNLARFVVACD